MRLDKFLAHAGMGTRKEVKKLIRSKAVRVNDQIVRNDDYKIEEEIDRVYVYEEEIIYSQFYYVMLNKPDGYISATMDDRDPTVIDLIYEDFAFSLFPVGRLDKDSEGLLLLTNDGALAHNLLSPKKHVDKEYHVILEKECSDDDIIKITQGVDLNEEEKSGPAIVKRIDEKSMYLTIQEGKFHQVKRMMHAIDNEVIYLKRVRMGTLKLDDQLALGEYRLLSDEEIKMLKGENE